MSSGNALGPLCSPKSPWPWHVIPAHTMGCLPLPQLCALSTTPVPPHFVPPQPWLCGLVSFWGSLVFGQNLISNTGTQDLRAHIGTWWISLVILKRDKQCSWAKPTQILLYQHLLCCQLLTLQAPTPRETPGPGVFPIFPWCSPSVAESGADSRAGQMLLQGSSLLTPVTARPQASISVPCTSLELLFALVLDANTTAHPKATVALGGESK